MDILFLVVVIVLFATIFSLFLWIMKRKEKKVRMIIIAIPIVLLLLFGITYIPKSIVGIDPTDVSKITVFDGSTGNNIEITDEGQIHHIITDLNEITFQKGKPSFMVMGYTFRTKVYDYEGNLMKELTINGSDKVRYKGFFYTPLNHSIDYEYIEKLVRS